MYMTPLLHSQKTRRLVIDAVLVALFVLCSVVFTVKTAFFEFSLASLPVLLCAALFSPWDALVVACLGSFVEQLLTYGLSYTTPLWMLPPLLQAVVCGIGFYVFRKKEGGYHRVGFFATILLAEVILTVTNTAALYADGAIIGYPVKALHLLLPTRAINGLVRLCLSLVLVPPLVRLLRRKNAP